MEIQEFISRSHLDVPTLDAWIEAEWLVPFASGTTTLRGSAGIFYDWLPTGTYDQSVRVDGLRQQELNIVDPAFPSPGNFGVVPGYLTERFPTVELNVTTYRLPKEHDLARWSAVPPGFVYTIKLSRLITHRKRPGEPRAFVDNYMQAIAPLEPHVAQPPPAVSSVTGRPPHG